MHCFETNSQLESIVLLDSVEIIKNYAFYKSGLVTISISENSNLTALEASCFSSTKLASIFIPKHLNSISTSAFLNCKLENIIVDSKNINYSSDTISMYSGEDNSTLFKVIELYMGDYIVPDYITKVSDFCFSGVFYISSIHFQGKITSIGMQSFSDCQLLESIVIPEMVTEIGKAAFVYCTLLTDISISKNIQIINANLFQSCSSLQNIIIPEKVTEIRNDAFDYCASLTSITIPGNVIYIGEHAFSNCNKLSSITFITNSKNITIGNSAFNNIPNPVNIDISGNFSIITSVTNAFPNRSHLYVTSETLLSENCQTFFGNCSVYVHLKGATKIKDQKTVKVIKYISIPQPKIISFYNFIYRQSKCSHLISLIPILTKQNTS